jgi:anti-anti-sigma regulatory factor
MTLTLSQPDPAPDLGTIRLIGHGSTTTAEDLRTQLVLASDAAEATTIDASEMLSVGQAVLQLLIAARHEAGLRNHRFHYTGASAAFSERVHGCQLANAIGLEIGKDVSL